MSRITVRAAIALALLAVIICLIHQRFSDNIKEVGMSNSHSDADVINELRQAGDLCTSPRNIDFYLYFPTRNGADAMGALLVADGYATHIRPAATDKSWLCLASKDLVPDLTTLTPISNNLTKLCANRQGDYDGWECKVIR